MIFIFVIQLIFTTKVQYLALFQSVYRTRKKPTSILVRWQDDFRTQKLPKKSVSVFHIGAVWKGMAAVVTVKYWLRNCRWRLANKVLLILSISDPLLFSQFVKSNIWSVLLHNCKFSNFPHSALIPLTIDNCFPAWAIHKHPGDRICRDVAPEHILLFYAEINSDSRP